jgi:hypothetical protein
MGSAVSIVRRLRRPRRVWITIALAAGLLEIGLQYFSLHPHPFEQISDRAARLSTEHGIVIGYGHPSTFFVPPYGPRDADIDGMQMIGADPSNLSAALEGIEEALATYPPGFVSRLVRAIFVAGELRFNGERAGGFTGRSWILLAAPDSSGAAGIRLNNFEGLHHELSSFVLQKANAMEGWALLTRADWPSARTSEEQLARGNDPDPPPDTGFLSAYAATTAENDFNTYAERIFTAPEALVALACKHGLVRKKLLFVLHTYVTLDARMGNVFHELGVDGAHLCERRWGWPR